VTKELINISPNRIYVKRQNLDTAFDTNNQYIKTSDNSFFSVRPQIGGPVMWSYGDFNQTSQYGTSELPWFGSNQIVGSTNFGAALAGCNIRSSLYNGAVLTTKFPEFDGNLVIMLGSFGYTLYQYYVKAYIIADVKVNGNKVGSIAGVISQRGGAFDWPYTRNGSMWLSNPTSYNKYSEFTNIPAGATITIGPLYRANGSTSVGATFTSTGSYVNDSTVSGDSRYYESMQNAHISLHAYKPNEIALPLALTS